MAKSAREWALELAAVGIKVFPLLPNSKRDPWTKYAPNGFRSATADPEQINKWFDENPDINYGCFGGDEFVIFDLDMKGEDENGIAVFTKYLGLDEFAANDLTFTVNTPTAGRHLYFTTENHQGVADRLGALPGVDIRGRNGYVVGPGSKIDGAEYEVINEREFVVVLDALKPMIAKARERSENQEPMFEWDEPQNIDRAMAFLKKTAEAIEGHTGDAWTYATICIVRDMAVGPDECLRLLKESGWNDRCDPPWGDDELQIKINNAYAYAKRQPGEKGTSSPEDIEALFKETWDEEIKKEKNKRFAAWEDNTYPLKAFREMRRPYNFICRDWFPAQGYTGFIAKRGVGKTTVLVDICLHLASDMGLWHGNQLEPGWTICYIIGEDVEGAKGRVEAWCRRYNRVISEDRIFFMDFAIDVVDGEVIANFIEFVKYKTQRFEKVLFVLDTFQRMIMSASKGMNDDAAMQIAAANMDFMAKKLGGPAFVAFHPPTHDSGKVHGSVVLENASNALIQIRNLDDSTSPEKKMNVSRMKGGSEDQFITFNFDKVGLGENDQFGKERTSVLVHATSGSNLDLDPVKVKTDRGIAGFLIEIINTYSTVCPNLKVRGALGMSLSLSSIVEVLREVKAGKATKRGDVLDRWLAKLNELNWSLDGDQVNKCSFWRNMATKLGEYPSGMYGVRFEKNGTASMVVKYDSTAERFQNTVDSDEQMAHGES